MEKMKTASVGGPISEFNRTTPSSDRIFFQPDHLKIKKPSVKRAPYDHEAAKGRLVLFRVLLLELLETACAVDEHFLPGEERMRCRAYFDLDDRVILSVGPLGGLFRVKGGTGKEFKVAGGIPEDYLVVLRMDVLLHFLAVFRKRTAKITDGGRFASPVSP